MTPSLEMAATQIPKDMKLLVSEKDFDKINIYTPTLPTPKSTTWAVVYEVAKWKNVTKNARRTFDTEDEGDQFVAMLGKCPGAVVISGPDPEGAE